MRYNRFKIILTTALLMGSALTFSASADCIGKMRGDFTVSPMGKSGPKYHLKDKQLMADVRPCYGHNGKPTYYISRDIGPIPAHKIELQNCHPVAHYKQGLWDAGYDLVENNAPKVDEGKSDKAPGEYLKTENLVTDQN